MNKFWAVQCLDRDEYYGCILPRAKPQLFNTREKARDEQHWYSRSTPPIKCRVVRVQVSKV